MTLRLLYNNIGSGRKINEREKKKKSAGSLDKAIEEALKESEEQSMKREEADRKKREEELKKTIGKIYKAVLAGKTKRARRILEEYAKKEGARIAMDSNFKRNLSRYSHADRPSHTIFFG